MADASGGVHAVRPSSDIVADAPAGADFYPFNMEYDARSPLTITGARASAMLYTFASLLAEGSPLGPGQMLVPPPECE